MTDAKDIGEQIKKARKLKGWSQIEFAKHLKNTQAYVSLVERGEQNFTVESLARISEVLGVDLVIQLKKRRAKTTE